MTREQALLASRLRRFDGATAEETAIVLTMAVDLASDAWRNQPRDSRGRWTGSGISSRAMRTLREEFPGIQHGSSPPEHEHIIQHAKALASAEARAHTAREIARVEAQRKAEMAKLIRQVRAANAYAAKTTEQEKTHKRRRALALHASTVVAGGLLAYAETKLGAGEITLIASAMGPTLAHDLVDWARRLAP
jgi:hypothetical protein